MSSPSTLTFGTLLRQLRRRVGMTQGDLASAVGYSVSFISSLEQNTRQPDVHSIVQHFVPALGLQDEPQLAARLLELAAAVRGDLAPATLTLTHETRTVLTETVDEIAHPLPIPPTLLIGREQEVKLLCNRMLRQGGRLLTLVGPPGIGKTRLGLEVATQLHTCYRDGACFVPLAAVGEPEQLPWAILTALGVTESSSKPPQTRLIEFLRRKEILLLLDNFEQIVAAGPLVAQLLEACPGLHVLVTSRERLHLRAEQRFPVPPLDTAFAVDLFVQQARSVDPKFELRRTESAILQEICQQLDCLPLAIELIAAHIDLFSPQILLARLKDRRLDLLDDGPYDMPERHRTWRNAIHRSYVLLGPNEQRLFRMLGVFAGGFDLEAVVGFGYAEQTLQVLVNRSLVRFESRIDGLHRGLLLETIREYAREQLVAQQELVAARQQHALCFLACVEKYRQIETPQALDVWLSSLDRNLDNLHVAFVWALEQGEVEITLRLMVGLHSYWFYRELQPWTRRLYQAGIRLADQQWSISPSKLNGTLEPALLWRIDLLAYALLCASELAARRPWDMQASNQLLDRCAELNQLTGIKEVTLFTLFARAHSERKNHNLEQTEQLANQILTLLPSVIDISPWNRKWLEVQAIQCISVCALARGDRQQLAILTQKMAPMFEEMDDHEALVCIYLNMGDAAVYDNDLEQAITFLTRCLSYGTGKGTFFEQCAKHKLGIVALRKGEPEKARLGYLGWIKFLHEHYGFWNVAEGLWGLADLANYWQQATVAAQLLGAADHLRQLTPDYFMPSHRHAYAATIATTRAQLDETTYSRAYAEGYAMTPDQAVSFALMYFSETKLEV